MIEIIMLRFKSSFSHTLKTNAKFMYAEKYLRDKSLFSENKNYFFEHIKLINIYKTIV